MRTIKRSWCTFSPSTKADFRFGPPPDFAIAWNSLRSDKLGPLRLRTTVWIAASNKLKPRRHPLIEHKELDVRGRQRSKACD